VGFERYIFRYHTVGFEGIFRYHTVDFDFRYHAVGFEGTSSIEPHSGLRTLTSGADVYADS